MFLEASVMLLQAFSSFYTAQYVPETVITAKNEIKHDHKKIKYRIQPVIRQVWLHLFLLRSQQWLLICSSIHSIALYSCQKRIKWNSFITRTSMKSFVTQRAILNPIHLKHSLFLKDSFGQGSHLSNAALTIL